MDRHNNNLAIINDKVRGISTAIIVASVTTTLLAFSIFIVLISIAVIVVHMKKTLSVEMGKAESILSDINSTTKEIATHTSPILSTPLATSGIETNTQIIPQNSLPIRSTSPLQNEKVDIITKNLPKV